MSVGDELIDSWCMSLQVPKGKRGYYIIAAQSQERFDYIAENAVDALKQDIDKRKWLDSSVSKPNTAYSVYVSSTDEMCSVIVESARPFKARLG